MTNRRVHDAVGLCMMAGRCRSGSFVAEKLVRAGDAKLVLLDVSASAATRGRYEGLCAGRGIPLLPVEGLGEAVGRPGRIVAAVTDQGFADMIRRAAGQAAAQGAPASIPNDRGHDQYGE